MKNELIKSVGATPSKYQLEYQKEELSAFVHFGINTFMDVEWGNGQENPDEFNPENLNTDQWIKALKEAGFKRVILTAKHHDGFCLWNSKYTEHSVAKSPWENGKGDIVYEVSNSCKKYGVKFAVYLSPWDQNSKLYGTGEGYNQYYINQLKELLSNYGDISEVWMDGAKGSNVEQNYNFQEWFELIKSYHKDCIIFSPCGPDIRWIGNEQGYAGDPCWSTIDISKMNVSVDQKYLNTGEENGPDWVIGECDVSIRPGWFYHETEDLEVKSLEKLIDIYFNSVGRNAVLLLNVPPNKDGLLHNNDVNRLKEFGQAIKDIFKDNLLENCKINSSSILNEDKKFSVTNIIDGGSDSYWVPQIEDNNRWVEIEFEEDKVFDVISIQEFIELGQRVSEFNVEAFINGEYKEVFQGRTIGYKRLIRINPIKTNKIKINFLKSLDIPLISNIGVFKQPKYMELRDKDIDTKIEFEEKCYQVNKSKKNIIVKVKRTGDMNSKLELDYTTVSGTAINGVDYQPWSGTLKFNEGEKEKSISIVIVNNDNTDNKYFYLRLEDNLNQGVLGEKYEATINIK